MEATHGAGMAAWADRAGRARIAVTGYFCIFGLCVGTWAPHIPLAKARLQADAGAFGLALLCMGLGAIIAMPQMSWLINRFGSAAVARATAAVAIASLILPFLAPNLPLFALALLLFGGALGALDVAMNAHGLAVENSLGKPVMSAFHGMFGVAALIGAGLSVVLITRIDEVGRALISVALCAVTIAAIQALMLPAAADKGKAQSSLALPTGKTLGLGLLCFLALMVEGSVVDWAGIYLREVHTASATTTSLAFAVFAGAMAVSRLLGDRARAKWGSALLTRWCALTTAAALLAAVLSPNAPVALLFFGLSGFFIGPIGPILFAGGGRADPENPGRGIAAATTLGYLGSVVGPPLVGFAADAASLAASLGIMAVFAVVIALYARLAAVADGVR